MNGKRHLHDELVDKWAICTAMGERELVYGSGYAPRNPDGTRRTITHREWCEAELARLRRKADFKARIAEGHGYVWLTRQPPRRDNPHRPAGG